MVDVLLKLDHYVPCLTALSIPISRSALKTTEFTLKSLKFHKNSGEIERDEGAEVMWRRLMKFLRLNEQRESKHKTLNIPTISSHNLPLIISSRVV